MFEPIVSHEAARSILSSRVQQLTDALGYCQRIWNKEYAFAQMVLDGSARAHLINQHWYAKAMEIFKDDNGVIFGKDQFQRYLIFDEQIILRFKLLDDNLNTSNYPTEHALAWGKQMSLPGLLPCGRLHYGYRFDITGTKIRDAFIILPDHGHNEWIWQTSGEPVDIFDTFGLQIPLSVEGAPKSAVYRYDNYPLGD